MFGSIILLFHINYQVTDKISSNSLSKEGIGVLWGELLGTESGDKWACGGTMEADTTCHKTSLVAGTRDLKLWGEERTNLLLFSLLNPRMV